MQTPRDPQSTAPNPRFESMSNRRWFAPRWRVLVLIGAVFLVANLLVRIGLMIFERDWANVAPLRLLGILGVGTLFDLIALSFVVLPFALFAVAWSNGRWGRLGHAITSSVLLLFGVAGLLFTAIAEFLFWNEFAVRFNFIAVDYLVYTREVIGNIQESYRMGPILAGLGVASLLVAATVARRYWNAARADGGRWFRRLGVFALICLLPVLAIKLVLPLTDHARDLLGTPAARELAGNGYDEFIRAFHNNDLSYPDFYKTIARSTAVQSLREDFGNADWKQSQASIAANDNAPLQADPLQRQIVGKGPEIQRNVVLVSIESLGWDYVGALGGKPGLTPNLDRLAADGMLFTQMYATGQRTVRGLEALTLSVPPTPGHAVPMRPDNKGFQTIGGIFKQHGYEPLYLYGGYSYFDNMKDFFSGNGYTVIDRNSIDAADIHHETIWGVADEDLFTLALRELDQRAAVGKLFFAHIMTTSNHRPFTYPADRVDVPSGSGRPGAVKYTDWAIGRFVDQARERPWFANTVFVFIADHTSRGRGLTNLPPENFRIPLIIYAPGFVQPQRIDTVSSQIDVAPTILSLLDFSYTSTLFGRDILGPAAQEHPRALMANYLTVGYMSGGLIAELSPKRATDVVAADTGLNIPANDPRNNVMIDKAVGYYQVASEILAGAPNLRKPATTSATPAPVSDSH